MRLLCRLIRLGLYIWHILSAEEVIHELGSDHAIDLSQIGVRGDFPVGNIPWQNSA